MDHKVTAAEGLNMMKQAIVGVLREHPSGLRNSEIAKLLDIQSDYLGAQKDFLSWSILGLLLNEGLVVRNGQKYSAADQS